MTKRKLNRRQKWRIEKIQAEKAARASKKAKHLEQDLALQALGSEQYGRVVAHYGQSVDIECLEHSDARDTGTSSDVNSAGSHVNKVYRCFVRANIDNLVTGDEVVWRESEQHNGVVETRLERRTLLQRPDIYGQLKPVAANIDRIVIVVASEPYPHANLIDRYLVAAETIGIQPAILFNKSDLVNESNREHIEYLYGLYEGLGYEVLRTSANDIDHCESELGSWLANFTSVFVGQSGVGKSSLIRSILGDESIKVGALSESTGKGTHTTTTAKLFHLPSGGMLVDSPGIREFGLWHIDEDELIQGFIEFRPFLGGCRFRDCKHELEPGCAIHGALESGDISEQRMTSYERIKESLDDVETFQER